MISRKFTKEEIRTLAKISSVLSKGKEELLVYLFGLEKQIEKAQIASEVASSAIVAKAGSCVFYQQVI